MAVPSKRRNVWHRAQAAGVGASDCSKADHAEQPAFPSKLSWQREPAGAAESSASARLSFSEQLAWIRSQGLPAPARPTPPAVVPDERPSALSLKRGEPGEATFRPSETSRKWVRPAFGQAGQQLKPAAGPLSAASGHSAAPARDSISAATAALSTRSAEFQQPTAALVTRVTSSDSSSKSTSSRHAIPSAEYASRRVAVARSISNQPEAKLRYTSSANGLTLRRVSSGSTKMRSLQQPSVQQPCERPLQAAQAAAHAHAEGRLPHACPAPCRSQQHMPQQQPSAPIQASLPSSLTHAVQGPSPDRQAAGQCSAVPATASPTPRSAGELAAKCGLGGRSACLKRTRSAAAGKALSSRSRKLQRLGNELYSSSGKGKLLRRGVQAGSLLKPVSGSATAEKTPPPKAVVYKRQGRQLVRQTSSRKSSLTRQRVKLQLSRFKPGSQRPQRKIPAQCLLYSRTGKCEAARQGRCALSHDPKKITICGRWLRGTCTRPDCPLQHCLQPHLLPVCTFFLQGTCSKEDCPYLHVNLDPDAPVCRDFVRGYCPRGAVCPHKHLTPKMVKDLRASKSFNVGRIASCKKVFTLRSLPKASPTLASLNSDLMKPSFLRDLDDDVPGPASLSFTPGDRSNVPLDPHMPV